MIFLSFFLSFLLFLLVRCFTTRLRAQCNPFSGFVNTLFRYFVELLRRGISTSQGLSLLWIMQNTTHTHTHTHTHTLHTHHTHTHTHTHKHTHTQTHTHTNTHTHTHKFTQKQKHNHTPSWPPTHLEFSKCTGQHKADARAPLWLAYPKGDSAHFPPWYETGGHQRRLRRRLTGSIYGVDKLCVDSWFILRRSSI
jgi:hypothetical protein